MQSKDDNGNNVWLRIYDRNAGNKLVSLRDSGTAGASGKTTLEYGTDGRLSRADFVSVQGTVLFHYEFEYNANGTLRKKQALPGSINLADDYSLYAYDVAGRLVADSVFVKSGLPAAYKLSQLATFTYTGDNVTEAHLYHYYTGSEVLDQRRRFEYDNANNPFRQIEHYYPISSTGGSLDMIRYVSTNNAIKEFAAEGNNHLALIYTHTYKYNSSNFPWKLNTELHTSQGKSETEFFYKQ